MSASPLIQAEKQPAAPENSKESPQAEPAFGSTTAAHAFRLTADNPRTAGPRNILSLQRAIGNRAVQKLLNVNKPNDPLERQADQVAAAVQGRPVATQSEPSGTSELPKPDAEFERRLQTHSADGDPLHTSSRSQLEPVLGADLSSVRVHTGPDAAALSRSIDAQAFTFANHIYFDSDKYAPGTSAGQELLAHEATHVVQQGMAPAIVQRRLNIPQDDSLPLINIDAVVEARSARTFEWHSQAERDAARQLFQMRHGQDILTWLQANVEDKAELVRSFAWVIDGLDSFPHVDLALAAIAGSVRVPPPAILSDVNLQGRAAIRRRYETTFAPLSPHHSLEHDLLFFYGGPLIRDFQKSIALLHHDLTDAEYLYFMGVGRERGGDVEALDVIKFIRDRWATGGYDALKKIDEDWANIIHMDRYWGWKYPAWSVHYFFNAVHYSIDSDKHQREIHPILTMYETMKDARKINPEQTLEQDLESELLSAYWTIESASKAGSEDQVRNAILLYHHIWRRYLDKSSVKNDPDLLKRLQDRYKGRAEALPTGNLKGLSALKKAILTPEDRLAELHGASAVEFEKFVTSAWLNDKPVFELLLASNLNNAGGRLQSRPMALALPSIGSFETRTQAAMMPHVGDSVPAKRAAVLLAANLTDEERGYHRLLLEFNPDLGMVRDIGSHRVDGDLQPIYTFLKTPGMTPQFREGILTTFARESLGAKSGNAAGHFLRHLYGRFEGLEGRWFLQILDLLDPNPTTEQRIERLRLKKDAGRSAFVGQVREGYDYLSGQGQDLSGGVDAGIKNVAAAKRKDFGFVLSDEHGTPVGEKLESMLYSISDSRIQELHTREDEIANTIAGVVEVGIESLVGFVAGPAGWAQVIAAIAGNLAGQAAKEELLGTANSAVSRANLKAVLMAGLGSYLFDVKDIRGTIAGLINADTIPLLQKLKKYDGNGLNLSWRTQSALQNVAAGFHDQGVSLIVGSLLDPIFLNSTDPARMQKDAAQAFARLVARPIHGAMYTFQVNPGAVTDRMKIGEKIKEQAGFKVAVKSSEKLGAELAANALSDPDFTFDDAIHVASVTMAKGIMNIAFKTVASSIASHQISQARLPLTERWLHNAPLEERHGVAGELVEKDGSLKAQFKKRFAGVVPEHEDGQPWPDDVRRVAGRWLETEGQFFDESGRFAHRQVSMDLEQKYAKAAKSKFGKVEENLSGRTKALSDRASEARERNISRTALQHKIDASLRKDPYRTRSVLSNAVMNEQRLRLKYLQEVYGPHTQSKARMSPGEWALSRIAAGDELVIQSAASANFVE